MLTSTWISSWVSFHSDPKVTCRVSMNNSLFFGRFFLVVLFFPQPCNLILSHSEEDLTYLRCALLLFPQLFLELSQTNIILKDVAETAGKEKNWLRRSLNCSFKHLWPTGILNIVKWANANTAEYSLHKKEENMTSNIYFLGENITMHICKCSVLTCSYCISIDIEQGRYSVNCLHIQRQFVCTLPGTTAHSIIDSILLYI